LVHGQGEGEEVMTQHLKGGGCFSSRTRVAAVCAAVALAGCTVVGADFVPPDRIDSPSVYRHAGTGGGQAAPTPPVEWWTIFGDETLNEFERLAGTRNSNLKAAAARLLQAQAQHFGARANLLPSLSVGASVENLRTSGNTPEGIALRGHSVSGSQYAAGVSMSYEVDLWGRLRRINEASDAQVEAAEADRAAVNLLLSTQLATTYWQWRGAQAEAAIVARMLEAYDEALGLTIVRFDSDLANEMDVSRAHIDRENAAIELRNLRREIDLYEHAISALVGQSASLPLPAASATGGILPDAPPISPGLPANLLAQRPDLAGSVAQLRAANAQIGVAEAAFYPSIQLTGSYGYASEELRSFLDNNSRQFDFGPLRLTLPIFDGGRNKANLLLAKARYEEAMANHRDKLLGALREVEDALSDGEHRDAQTLHMERARREAARTVAIAQARHDRGLTTYIEVLNAQRGALNADRNAAQIRVQRLLSCVALVRAMGGGGWVRSPRAAKSG
jgi:outer membrane protein, multidrug efflux system